MISIQEAKKWLNRAYMLNDEIRDLERRRDEAYAYVVKIIPDYSAKESQYASGGNSSEQKLVNYTHFQHRVQEALECQYAFKCEIDEMISNVEDMRFRRLLKMRYIDFYTWEHIAEEIGVDMRHIYRLHGKSLSIVGNLIYRKGEINSRPNEH